MDRRRRVPGFGGAWGIRRHPPLEHPSQLSRPGAPPGRRRRTAGRTVTPSPSPPPRSSHHLGAPPGAESPGRSPDLEQQVGPEELQGRGDPGRGADQQGQRHPGARRDAVQRWEGQPVHEQRRRQGHMAMVSVLDRKGAPAVMLGGGARPGPLVSSGRRWTRPARHPQQHAAAPRPGQSDQGPLWSGRIRCVLQPCPIRPC